MVEAKRRTHAKGVLPDGAKLRALREKSGLTIEQIASKLQPRGVMLRTYQRAEQGVAVTPVKLQGIAALYGVDVKEVRLERSLSPDPDKKEAFRLANVTRIGTTSLIDACGAAGLCIFEWVFDLNPTPELAEKIALIVEHCERLNPKQREINGASWGPADKIRAIGALNHKLAELAQSGVYMYAGEYIEWRTMTDNLAGMTWEDTGKDAVVHLPCTDWRMKVVFAERDVEHIVDSYSSQSTREAAFKKATDRNLAAGLQPHWIREGSWFASSAYITHYEQQVKKTPPLVSRGMIIRDEVTD